MNEKKLLTNKDIQTLKTYGLLKLVKDNRYIRLALETEKALKDAGFRDLDLTTYMVQLSRMLATLLERNVEIKEKLSSLNAKEKKKVIMTLSLALVERLIIERIATIITHKRKREEGVPIYRLVREKVFVIMPLGPNFDYVWKEGIEPSCKSRGFDCVRADKLVSPTSITSAIEKHIEMADFVIADITGVNPNVMYELGLARAKGKKIIAIRQLGDRHEVPFDIAHIPYILYVNTRDGVRSLSKEIGHFLESASRTS